MKKILIIGIALLFSTGAFAQASSNAQQTSQSQSVAQGSIQFSQTPEHTDSTVRNVSAPILGAYASSFSQFNCGQTTQGGFAVAGFSGAFGSSKDQKSCVLEVASAETARQSTITPDVAESARLRQAAINMRCQISAEVYNALVDAGMTCSKKPSELRSRTDDQPESTKISG